MQSSIDLGAKNYLELLDGHLGNGAVTQNQGTVSYTSQWRHRCGDLFVSLLN
jgi:hypothetical protein